MTHAFECTQTPLARLHRRAKRSGAALALLSTIAVGGCNDYEDAANATPATESLASAEPLEEARLDGVRAKGEGSKAQDSDITKAPVTRKLIQTAELHVKVKNYAAARTAIESDLADFGGFIADARVDHHDGQVSSATMTVRVPSANLADFLAGAAGRGDILHESLSSKDITAGYYDSKARLKNAQRLETRLLALLDDKGDSVTSLLEVERELARVRGQIEGIEGKLRLWDSQVALSTVELRIVTEQVYAVTQPPTVGERIAGVFGGSWTAMKAFGMGLLLFLVALVPWLLPLSLVGFAIRTLIKRWQARRAAAAPPARSGSQPHPVV